LVLGPPRATVAGMSLPPGLSPIEAGRFGLSLEPIVAYLASRGVTALITDLVPDDQRAGGWRAPAKRRLLEKAFKPNLVDRSSFDRLVSYRSVDMNQIPDDLRNFASCWSICALEHLGSIAAGKDLVLNAMRCLKPGGVAVHTTEYNCLSSGATVDYSDTVLFQQAPGRDRISTRSCRSLFASYGFRASDGANGPLYRRASGSDRCRETVRQLYSRRDPAPQTHLNGSTVT